MRIATLPGVTEEMLARVMSADMAELRRRGAAVAAALDAGVEARITCAHGSDLRLGLEGRTAIPDAGELTATGAFGNLPCGEGFIAPLEGTGEGTLVVDGSIAGVGMVDAPVTLTVRDGHLADATGTEGATLMELLTAHGRDGTNVAELGIGTNEKAILTGNILEDEKILGTAHVAFGASAAIGGTVQVPVHLDCVILEPTVEIDGEPTRPQAASCWSERGGDAARRPQRLRGARRGGDRPAGGGLLPRRDPPRPPLRRRPRPHRLHPRRLARAAA